MCVILLTATINPDGMSYTVLQDRSVRKEQYEKALDFYLHKTKSKIVFCENSGVDISDRYVRYINEGRIEFLTFIGNDFDKTLGKGYGEALIILYALKNSSFLKDDAYIIKITGRLIIENINEIIRSVFCLGQKFIRCDFRDNNSIYSMIFISPRNWLMKLSCYMSEIDDSQGVLIEHILYKMLCDLKCSILPFFSSPLIKGISGGSGKIYKRKGYFENIINNFFCLSTLLKKKGCPYKSYVVKVFAYFFYLIKRWKR